jgi:hypothetical protein
LRLSTAAARPHLDGSSPTERSNLRVSFKKSDVKIDSVYSQRYMKQRAKIVERNQAMTMKKILCDFQESIQLSRFTSELATFDWFSRYQFRSDGSLGLLDIFGLIGAT